MEIAGRKQSVGIGLVGSGFMGRCHANAFTAVSGCFDVPVLPEKSILADASRDLAERRARELGFSRSTADWKELVEDDQVDIVAIAAPNALHEQIALAAIEAGKTIYCEKPLSTTVESALRMTEAAEAAGVITSVGFNFLRNPMIGFARRMIETGEIGDVTGFRGRHAENYMACPNVAHSFRTDRTGGGAAADIGSHIISLARYLLGPVDEVSGDCRTIHPMRPAAPGADEWRPVEVDDMDARIASLQERCVRKYRGELGRDRTDHGSVIRDYRNQGCIGLQPGTHERVASLSMRRASVGLHQNRVRARPSAVWIVLPGSGASSGFQRPQGH